MPIVKWSVWVSQEGVGLLQRLLEAFAWAQQWLFETVAQPLMFRWDMGNVLEDAYDGCGWLLIGLMQMLVIALVLRPLERLNPAQPEHDRRAIRTDVLYTVIHRLGLFRVALFLTLEPWFDEAFGWARAHGWSSWQLDQWWPGVSDQPIASFFVYLLVFDFLDYWYHRAQHQFNWWWALHSVHHSQQTLTSWSDNRNHLLDDLIRDLFFVCVAQLVGVPPGQFIAVVAATRMLESLSHANLPWDGGRFLSRLVVLPRFHRYHHAVGAGHESDGKGTLGGHNFAVLFPVWDLIFGTARIVRHDEPTGIRDQLPEEGGRDYGTGFWRQQWLGLCRMVGRG